MVVEKKITVINRLGLHARAAARLVKLSATFHSTITLSRADVQADAKSIMAVLMLAASQGSELLLSAEGRDSRRAVDAISALFADYFGEGE